MARFFKKTSTKTVTKKQASQPAKKGTMHKILTAEGWKRLMMGKMAKKAPKRK